MTKMGPTLLSNSYQNKFEVSVLESIVITLDFYQCE